MIYLTVLLFSHCFLIKIRTYSKTSWLSFRDKSANNVAKFKDRLAKVTWDELSKLFMAVKIDHDKWYKGRDSTLAFAGGSLV